MNVSIQSPTFIMPGQNLILSHIPVNKIVQSWILTPGDLYVETDEDILNIKLQG